MTKLMIDIETLDTASTALVLSVCLMPFTRDGRVDDDYETFYAQLPAGPQYDRLGRTMSLSTVSWWMDQQSEAKDAWKDSIRYGTLIDLHTIVQMLADKVTQIDPTEVWARGPQFDLGILESLMAQLDVQVPWQYDQWRDLRTLMAAVDLSVKDVPVPVDFVKHNPVSDCKFQIACYRQAMELIRG